MMASIPEFEDESPVYQPVQVESEGKGFEEFAKSFGQAAEVAESSLVNINKQHSQIMMLNSVADIQKAKTEAMVSNIQHPEQSESIANNFKNLSETVVNNAAVGSVDRANLNKWTQGQIGEIQVQSAKTGVGQAKIDSLNAFYSSNPQTISAIRSAFIQNPESDVTKSLIHGYMDTLNAMRSSGLLTEGAYTSHMKNLQLTLDGAQAHVRLYGQDNITAQDYQTSHSHPANFQASLTRGGTPVDGDISYLKNHYNSDYNFQGVKSFLSEGGNPLAIPQPLFDEGLTPAQKDEVINFAHGQQIGQGVVHARDYTYIDQVNKDYAQKAQSLSQTEQGLKNVTERYIQGLKDGKFYQMMADDPQGQPVIDDAHKQEQSVIASGVLSPEYKMKRLNEIETQKATSLTAIGLAKGIPVEYINPIAPDVIQSVKGAFLANGTPEVVEKSISTIESYPKGMQGYLAKGMQNAAQQTAVMTIAYSDSTYAKQDKVNYLMALQKNLDFLGTDKDGMPSKVITNVRNRVVANLQRQLGLIQQQFPGAEGVEMQKALIDNTTRVAKYYAYMDGNSEITNTVNTPSLSRDGVGQTMSLFNSNWKRYADKASELPLNSFTQRSGSNWIINDKQMSVPYSNAELDTLAQYAVNQGSDWLKNNIGEAKFNYTRDRGQLYMTITPQHQLQARDASGHIAFSEQLTANTLDHANATLARQKNADIQQAMKLSPGSFRAFEQASSNPFVTQSELSTTLNPFQQSHSRGVRNNNPGNIEKTAEPWEGEMQGIDSRFKTFRTPQDGIRAMSHLLRSYATDHGVDSIDKLINRYSTTDRKDYKAFVANRLGLNSKDNLDLKDVNTRAKVMNAIIEFENKTNPYGEQVVNRYAG